MRPNTTYFLHLLCNPDEYWLGHLSGNCCSVSSDGGATWPDARVDTELVCQASVAPYRNSGGLLFSDPSHPRSRLRMTMQQSLDDGVSWSRQVPMYPGPAGYSVLGVLSNKDVLVLYERGKLSYFERPSIARVSAATFQ